MTYSHIRVEPIAPHVGAEIGGVDLTEPVADQTFAEIRHAFGKYGVIFFRDQLLSPEQRTIGLPRDGVIEMARKDRSTITVGIGGYDVRLPGRAARMARMGSNKALEKQ